MEPFFLNEIPRAVLNFPGGETGLRNEGHGSGDVRAYIGNICIVNAVKLIHMRPCPVFTLTPDLCIFRGLEPLNKGVHLFGFQILKASAHGHIENKALGHAELESRAYELYGIPRLDVLVKGFANGKLAGALGKIGAAVGGDGGFFPLSALGKHGFKLNKPRAGNVGGDYPLRHLGCGTRSGSHRVFNPHSENRKAGSSCFIKILGAENSAVGGIFLQQHRHQFFKRKGS